MRKYLHQALRWHLMLEALLSICLVYKEVNRQAAKDPEVQ